MGDVSAVPRKGRGWWRWIGCALHACSILLVIAVIVWIGWMQLTGKYKTIRNIDWVGHSDSAAYANTGWSISQGRGLQVEYISYYFIPYSPEITRREDHWPPFMGLAMAPCFYFLGKAAWVAKLPAIFFGSIGLPLTTALLAYALSRRGYVAIVAGLLMLAHPLMYGESLKILSDVATAMLIAGFCGSVVLAQRRPWMHVAAGAFLACAFFSKGSQIILLGMYPLMAVLCTGPQVVIRKWFWAGMATAVLLMAPFWYGTWKAYGSPLHSTQNFVSGFYGISSWSEVKAYFPYWGHNVPKTSDLWKDENAYWQRSGNRRLTIAQFAVSGERSDPEAWDDFGKYGLWLRNLLRPPIMPSQPVPQPRGSIFNFGSPTPAPVAVVVPPKFTWPPFDWHKPLELKSREMVSTTSKGDLDFKWSQPISEVPAAGALLLIGLLVAGLPLMFVVELGRLIRWGWRKWKGIAPAAKRPGVRPPWMIGPVLAITLVLVAEGGFLAYFWNYLPRFCFQFLPLVAALGCTAWSRVFEWPVLGVVLVIEGISRLVVRGKARTAKAAVIVAGIWRGLGQWHVIVTIVFALVVLSKREQVYGVIRDKVGSGLSTGEDPRMNSPTYPQMGAYLAAKLPDAVVMCRNPWELLFYTAPTNKGIALPYAIEGGSRGADQVLAIANYYHVTHYFEDESRPQWTEYVASHPEAFKRVIDAPGALYRIDWTKIKVKTPEEVCGGNSMGTIFE